MMTYYDIKTYCQGYSVDSLPQVDYLLSLLSSSDSLGMEAEISEYSNTYRWSWWFICPSVGYDMVNSRPMVILNTSGIISHFQNKRVIERKELSIRKKSELTHQGNSVRLISFYEDLKINIIQLHMIHDSYLKYKQLFDIKKSQYKNNEINSEQFLKEEISFNERKKIIASQVDRINQKFTDIELLLNTCLFRRLNYDKLL